MNVRFFILVFLLLMTVSVSVSGQQEVQILLTQGNCAPAASRNVTLTPLGLTPTGYVPVIDKIYTNTDVNGSLWVTLWPGYWQCDVKPVWGGTGTTTFYFVVNTNAVQSAFSNLVTTIDDTFPGPEYAYPAAVSDARYLQAPITAAQISGAVNSAINAGTASNALIALNTSLINGIPLLTTNWNPAIALDSLSPLAGVASYSSLGNISFTNPLLTAVLSIPIGESLGFAGQNWLTGDTNGNQFWGLGANWMQIHPTEPVFPTLQVNLGIGPGALQDMTSGSNNIALGAGSIWRVQNSQDNTAVGAFVAGSPNYANENVFIGYLTAFSLLGTAIPGDVGNTVIGSQALWQASDAQNSIVIGYFRGAVHHGRHNEQHCNW
jgi:hypothetical protein